MSSRAEPGGGCLPLLRWQFDVAWSLLAHHLPHLDDELALWEAAPGAITVRPSSEGDGGTWRADWPAGEEDAGPPVTVGWLLWHLSWWWTDLLGAVGDGPRVGHDEHPWPGSTTAARQELLDLHRRWLRAVEGWREEDLDRGVRLFGPEPTPLGRAVAWCTAELMKNAAEIGLLRHLHVSQQQD